MNRKPSSRRRFFQESAALAGLALGVGQSSLAQTPQGEQAGARPTGFRAYGERSKYDTFTRLEDDHEEAGLTTPIQVQMPNRNGFLPELPQWSPGMKRRLGYYPNQ